LHPNGDEALSESYGYNIIYEHNPLINYFIGTKLANYVASEAKHRSIK